VKAKKKDKNKISGIDLLHVLHPYARWTSIYHLLNSTLSLSQDPPTPSNAMQIEVPDLRE
jgi:hypothetical protein